MIKKFKEQIKTLREEKALKKALGLDKPVLLDVILDPKEIGFYLPKTSIIFLNKLKDNKFLWAF